MRTTFTQQRAEMKKKHPEMMILWRVGDFYELYDGDAELAGRVLGLTVTTRESKGGVLTPMTGFPHQALEGHLRKLIAAKHRVAICEQEK